MVLFDRPLSYTSIKKGMIDMFKWLFGKKEVQRVQEIQEEVIQEEVQEISYPQEFEYLAIRYLTRNGHKTNEHKVREVMQTLSYDRIMTMKFIDAMNDLQVNHATEIENARDELSEICKRLKEQLNLFIEVNSSPHKYETELELNGKSQYTRILKEIKKSIEDIKDMQSNRRLEQQYYEVSGKMGILKKEFIDVTIGLSEDKKWREYKYKKILGEKVELKDYFSSEEEYDYKCILYKIINDIFKHEYCFITELERMKEERAKFDRVVEELESIIKYYGLERGI